MDTAKTRISHIKLCIRLDTHNMLTFLKYPGIMVLAMRVRVAFSNILV